MRQLRNLSKEEKIDEIVRSTQVLLDYAETGAMVDVVDGTKIICRFFTEDDMEILKAEGIDIGYGSGEVGLELTEDNLKDIYFLERYARHIPEEMLIRYYEMQEKMNKGCLASMLAIKVNEEFTLKGEK